jgi:hypothetical protein
MSGRHNRECHGSLSKVSLGEKYGRADGPVKCLAFLCAELFIDFPTVYFHKLIQRRS